MGTGRSHPANDATARFFPPFAALPHCWPVGSARASAAYPDASRTLTFSSPSLKGTPMAVLSNVDPGEVAAGLRRFLDAFPESWDAPQDRRNRYRLEGAHIALSLLAGIDPCDTTDAIALREDTHGDKRI
jgi:hypothetical protein